MVGPGITYVTGVVKGSPSVGAIVNLGSCPLYSTVQFNFISSSLFAFIFGSGHVVTPATDKISSYDT